MNASEFAVFSPSTNQWLQEDEKTWGTNFLSAALFTYPELALQVRDREGATGSIIMGIMS